MISNERPSPYGRRPYSSLNAQPYNSGYNSGNYNPVPRPHVAEDTLKSAEIQVERKFFTVTLKENPRGRFLRITEDIGGRRNTIIIPSTGLGDFRKILEDMVKASDELPPKSPTPPANPE